MRRLIITNFKSMIPQLENVSTLKCLQGLKVDFILQGAVKNDLRLHKVYLQTE